MWEAADLILDRAVALKLLHISPFLGHSGEEHLREARIASKLAHPGITRIYATGVELGVPFIAQELVGDGRTLRDQIDERRNERGGRARPGRKQRDPVRDGYQGAAELMLAIARAVSAAHSAGVIHRDIKPVNILLRPNGRPVVADFGIAALADEEEITRTGFLKGAPQYLAPEQILSGKPQRDVRTDVYALGVTMYELLTLTHPFPDTVMGRFDKVVKGDFRPPRRVVPAIPAPLEDICMRAMSKKLDERYSSTAELAQALERWLAGSPLPVPWRQRAARFVKGRRRLQAIVGAILVSVALLTTLYLAMSPRDQAHAETRAEAHTRLMDQVRIKRDEIQDLTGRARALRTRIAGKSADYVIDMTAEMVLDCDAEGLIGIVYELLVGLDGLTLTNPILQQRRISLALKANDTANHYRRLFMLLMEEWITEAGGPKHADQEEVLRTMDHGRALKLGSAAPEPDEYRSDLGVNEWIEATQQLLHAGHIDQARQGYHLIIELLERAGLGGSLAAANAEALFAGSYWLRGDFEDAENHMRRAVAIADNLPDREDPETAAVRGQVHNSLGVILRDQGRWIDAMVELEHGLAIRRALFETDGGLPDRLARTVAKAALATVQRWLAAPLADARLVLVTRGGIAVGARLG